MHLTVCLFLVITIVIICVDAKGSFIQKVIDENRLQSSTFEFCRAKGECFSGAWLGTVKHLLENPLIEQKFPNEKILKSQSTLRCEDASFYFFHHMFEVKKDPNPAWGISPIQTIDLLDFSVLHLSTLERVQKHCLRVKGSKQQITKEKEMLNKKAAQQLQKLRKNVFNSHEKNALSIRKRAIADSSFTSSAAGVEDSFARTLVVMPFLVTTVGESSTSLANKKIYFKLCFDSLFPLFRNIFGAVINAADQKILQNSRPFREVLLLNDRRNDCELPMLALLAVKRLLKTNAKFAASFDFIYFTEGDQVLIGRQFPQIFSFLTKNPFTVLTPHRLVLAPTCVLSAFNRSVTEVLPLPNILDYSCCMDTSSHGLSRTHWKPLFSPQTTLLQLFGMPVIAGNGNLFQQNYRVCNITRRVESCPAALRFVDYSSHADSDVTLIFSDHMRQQAKAFLESPS